MASLVGAVKPYVNNWAAPVAVSPLIRAARWGALLAGIYYGSSRLNALREPAKAEKDAYLAQKVRHSSFRPKSLVITIHILMSDVISFPSLSLHAFVLPPSSIGFVILSPLPSPLVQYSFPLHPATHAPLH